MFSPQQVIQAEGRWFKITGVHLGAIGHTSLVSLLPLSEKPGGAYGKNVAEELLVPEVLLRALVKGTGVEIYELRERP